MKSFDQLAQSAYEAFMNAMNEQDRGDPHDWPRFDELHQEARACWLAVAQQLTAEIAAIH
ncbi:MAG: hypothetical protein ACKVOO_12490 [Burkholderiaceae bacterium]